MNIHRGSENSCFEKLDKSEAAAQRCFVKKVFLKVSHVEFRSLFSNKVAGLRPGVFLWILQNSKEQLFYKTSPVCVSEKFHNIFGKETHSETPLNALSCCFFRIAKPLIWHHELCQEWSEGNLLTSD